MANPYFTYTNPLIPGQTARSGQINAEESSQQSAFDSVYADMIQAFRTTGRTPGAADMAITALPAACALKVIGFDATGTKVALYSSSLNPRGVWLTGTPYARGDVVTQGVEQSLYYCAIGHTAGTFSTDLAGGNWVKLIDNTAAYQASFNPKIITIVNSPYQALAGDDLLVDVTAGPVAVLLPGSPALGNQPVGITHLDGNIVTNNITVSQNGNRIMGLTEDMIVSDPYASLMLGFSDATRGWRLIRGT